MKNSTIYLNLWMFTRTFIRTYSNWKLLSFDWYITFQNMAAFRDRILHVD